MEHRHMSNQLMIPGHYQHENNHPPVEQSYIPMVRSVTSENGCFFPPVDHSITVGARFNPGCDLGGRSNENYSSNIGMGTHLFPPPFLRPPLDPRTHTSTNGNTSLAPVGPVGHIHSAHTISNSGGPGKRKTPDVFEGSSSSFYGAGSSSGSQMLIQKPDVGHLSQPPYWGASLSINSQDSMRNVRRRLGPELEPCTTSAHAPNYDSRYYQPMTHSTNYSVPVHPFNPSADGTGREWNIVPYANGRTSHTDDNDWRSETNQFYAGGSFGDINVSHHNTFPRGNLSSFSQNPPVSHVQPTIDGPSYHRQSVTQFYTNGPNYCYYNNGSSSSTNELQFPSENLSSRYSMHSAVGGSGGGGYWVRWPRPAVERPQPLINVIDSHHEFGHETVTFEQSSFYHEPSNLPDEYQDLRLDIDDMSYEELLALEERMGYVSSGLSEDRMSNCLTEKTYHSMDENHDSCPICLEEYKNGEKIGRIEKCGHEYHVDCIKQWVMMKKVCPICKSEC